MKIWNKLLSIFNRSNSEDNKINTENIDNNIYVMFSLDNKFQNVTCSVNIPDIESAKNKIDQAENVANLLHKICDDNVYITGLVLETIESFKKQSDDHVLFIENILFFWKFLLQKKFTNDSSDKPMISPLSVFTNR